MKLKTTSGNCLGKATYEPHCVLQYIGISKRNKFRGEINTLISIPLATRESFPVLLIIKPLRSVVEWMNS
jgi:hypothetical protein